MRTLLTAITCLMLFTMPVMAGNSDESWASWDFDRLVEMYEGFCHGSSCGSEGDGTKFFNAFEEFAEDGDLFERFEAEYYLGLMHWHGQHLWWRNRKKAIRIWEKAAKSGNASSQTRLARTYWLFEGFKDYVKAYAWFSAASAQGSRPYIMWEGKPSYNYESLKEKMTPEQIAKGKSLARTYVKKYVP